MSENFLIALYTFWTMPILIFSTVQIIMGHPLPLGNVMGIIWPPGWNRVNWSPKSGGKCPPPPPSALTNYSWLHLFPPFPFICIFSCPVVLGTGPKRLDLGQKAKLKNNNMFTITHWINKTLEIVWNQLELKYHFILPNETNMACPLKWLSLF